jgi:hypothetical protein
VAVAVYLTAGDDAKWVVAVLKAYRWPQPPESPHRGQPHDLPFQNAALPDKPDDVDASGHGTLVFIPPIPR